MEEVNELEELQEQVKLLEDRVYTLERRDASRRARGWLSILIKLLLFIALVFGAFYAYNYITNELPTMIENEVKEKGNVAVDKVKEKGSNVIDTIKDTIKGN